MYINIYVERERERERERDRERERERERDIIYIYIYIYIYGLPTRTTASPCGPCGGTLAPGLDPKWLRGRERESEWYSVYRMVR